MVGIPGILSSQSLPRRAIGGYDTDFVFHSSYLNQNLDMHSECQLAQSVEWNPHTQSPGFESLLTSLVPSCYPSPIYGLAEGIIFIVSEFSVVIILHSKVSFVSVGQSK